MKNLKIGDKVKVKSGVMCPDTEELDIGGWQGKIAEILKDDDNKTLVCIEWDIKTMENMPSNFIDQGEEEGLCNDLMCLYIEEVELIDNYE